MEAAKRLGYVVLKKEQKEVITSFVHGRDVLAVLPTGLCYSCLPLVFDGIRDDYLLTIIIIIKLLTAIMKDQVSSINDI